MAGVVRREPRTGTELVPTFEALMDEWFRTFPFRMGRFGRTAEDMIRVDEFEQEGELVVRAELPGIDPAKDAEITVQPGLLTIDVHREERKEEERPDGYRSEFRYGSFHRSVPLPDGVADADVKASYKDGILEIRLPVKENAPGPVTVPVERG